jgi:RES domain
MELGETRHADYRWTPDGIGARGRRFPDHVDPAIYDPLDYRVAQALGSNLRAKNYEGVRYNSVRDEGGECFGTFRPAAVQSVHDQVQTIEIEWDGAAVRSYNLIDTYYLEV